MKGSYDANCQSNQFELDPGVVPGARLEVDYLELGLGDGPAAGEEPRVGRVTVVLAPLAHIA